jgi:ribosomal protein S27AE
MKTERCPKCGSEMVDGFLLDRDKADRVQTWFEGEVSKYWFGMLRLRGRARFGVLTRRCRRCGFLESFATGPER